MLFVLLLLALVAALLATIWAAIRPTDVPMAALSGAVALFLLVQLLSAGVPGVR